MRALSVLVLFLLFFLVVSAVEFRIYNQTLRLRKEEGGGRRRLVEEGEDALMLLKTRRRPSEVIAVVGSNLYIVRRSVLLFATTSRSLKEKEEKVKGEKETKEEKEKREKEEKDQKEKEEHRNNSTAVKKDRRVYTPKKRSDGITKDSIESEADEYGEYLPEYKYPPQIAEELSFIAKTVYTNKSSSLGQSNCTARYLGLGRYKMSCTVASVTAMSQRQDVLWLSRDPIIRGLAVVMTSSLPLSVPANESLESTGAEDIPHDMKAILFPFGGVGKGLGQSIMISDTSLDLRHHGFYNGSGIVPFNSISTTMHSKMLGVLNGDANTYYAADDAHGTCTSGIAAMYEQSDMEGVASKSKLLFITMSPILGSEYMTIPDGFYTDIENACRYYRIQAFGGSWGAVGMNGLYTDLNYVFDTIAFENPFCMLIFSCGNDGPTNPCNPPSTGKNVMSVGATLFDVRYQAGFSSGGLYEDGRRGPLVSAPGVNVVCPRAIPFAQYGHTTGRTMSGSSASAPPLVAAHALLREDNGGNISNTRFITTTIAHTTPTVHIAENSLGTKTIDGVPISTYGVPQYDLERMLDIDGSQLPSGEVYSITCWTPEPGATAEIRAYDAVLSWMDVPSIPGSDPPLVNDLDLVFITDLEVAWAENGLNPHEFVRNVTMSTFLRVVVFAFGAALTEAPVNFSVHIRLPVPVNGDRDQIVDLVEVGCGADACLPGDVLNCTESVGHEQFCTVNGSYSECFPRVRDSGGGTDPCTLKNALRAYLSDETCVVAECKPYYTIRNDTFCACVPETFRDCGGHTFTKCKADTGEFELCNATVSKTVKLVRSLPGGASALQEMTRFRLVALIVMFTWMLF